MYGTGTAGAATAVVYRKLGPGGASCGAAVNGVVASDRCSGGGVVSIDIATGAGSDAFSAAFATTCT
jgi:hypothetical protein